MKTAKACLTVTGSQYPEVLLAGVSGQNHSTQASTTCDLFTHSFLVTLEVLADLRAVKTMLACSVNFSKTFGRESCLF